MRQSVTQYRNKFSPKVFDHRFVKRFLKSQRRLVLFDPDYLRGQIPQLGQTHEHAVIDLDRQSAPDNQAAADRKITDMNLIDAAGSRSKAADKEPLLLNEFAVWLV